MNRRISDPPTARRREAETLARPAELSAKLEDGLPDRRVAVRHRVSAAVRLASHEGLVQNLSTRGLYFVTPASIRVGALVELEVTLPHATPAGPLNCRVTARVIRVETLGGSKGVAAQIEAWSMPDPDADC